MGHNLTLPPLLREESVKKSNEGASLSISDSRARTIFDSVAWATTETQAGDLWKFAARNFGSMEG